MATLAAAEIAADAILIGRYFGRSSSAAALARAAASASTASSRPALPAGEGDGPGVRMMASAGGPVSGVAMSLSGPGTSTHVRFMSMFGGARRNPDPVMAEAIAKCF